MDYIDPYSDLESWKQSVPEKYHERPEYSFLDPDVTLPDVLLIGDSLSMSYTLGVRDRLAGYANVFRAPDNCRSTRQTREQIEVYLGRREWRLIHFNWGMHDITLFEDGKSSVSGTPQVSKAEYRNNYEWLLARLRRTKAKLIWATTTPVADHVELRSNENVDAYNLIASRMIEDSDVEINDLHALVQTQVTPIWSDGVHLTKHGADIAAEAVANSILRVLDLDDVSVSP